MGRRAISASLILLLLAACGEADRCLDLGGRWNDEVDVCEFGSAPLDTPGKAIDAGKRTLEFSFGQRVLSQEPFLAELDGSIWHVRGTRSEEAREGTAHAWIEMGTGRVIEVRHGQKGPAS